MPAKLLNGGMPHGKKRCRLQLLFLCLIVTDLHSSIMVLIYSVDAIPLQIPVSLLTDVVRFRPHRLRVSIPEPCPVSNSDYYSLDRVLEALTVLLFMLLLRLMQLLAV